MESTVTVHSQYPVEARLVFQALQGEEQAINQVLVYLSSDNPHLQQIMKNTLHECFDERLYHCLLQCMVLHQWCERLDCSRRDSPSASTRIDQAIEEVFVEDRTAEEARLKDRLLIEEMKDEKSLLRQAAACLLGKRGNAAALPLLAEMIRSNAVKLRIWAIEACGKIQNEESAMLLIEALAMDRGPIHKAAGNSLTKLGKAALPAWCWALRHADRHIRWHAARALGVYGDASAAPALAEGLYDEDEGVRWASARVLSDLGEVAIPVVLKTLSRRKLTAPARQAAYHALHSMNSLAAQRRLAPLLRAMKGPSADVEAPIIAQRLLADWVEIKAARYA